MQAPDCPAAEKSRPDRIFRKLWLRQVVDLVVDREALDA